jgi:RNA polymerase sigma-70 factor, ECF subfamily
MSDDDAFEPHRRFLVGLAYRMLGSVAEAEDVVQDAFVRWTGVADKTSIAEPRAYLARTVSRLCLDRMKSARARREHYVGTWLPEPFVDADQTFAADLSVALLMTLERLSPLERAAFLLHDVFDMDYRDVGEVLDRSDDACRQLAARAREHVRDERPRFTATEDTSMRLAAAFHAAMQNGDVAQLAQLLAEDAVLYTDGGGKKLAALNPIYGRDKILRFVDGVTHKPTMPIIEHVEPATINGLPGFVLRTNEGVETLAVEVVDDRIVAIYLVRNPDKLRHLS